MRAVPVATPRSFSFFKGASSIELERAIDAVVGREGERSGDLKVRRTRAKTTRKDERS